MTTLAVFPGSFDPPTLGHLSLIRRAAALWDEVVVVVAINPSKAGWLSPEERVELLEDMVRLQENVSVCATDDLVVAFADDYREQASQVVLLRGVRDSEDLDYELMLAHANRELGHGMETVFLPAAQSLQQVSSTQVRDRIERGEAVGELLHPRTAASLRREN
ncbi:MAG: pantetheine-phosphate adenylyltransferase [Persicimonas sp.]